MFYVKPLIGKKTTNFKLSFTSFSNTMTTEIDEGLLPYKRAKLSYNFNIKNGALTDGYGFKNLCLPKSLADLSDERQIVLPGVDIKKVWHFKFYDQTLKRPAHQLLMYGQGGQIYWAKFISIDPFASPVASNSLYPNAIPNALNYRMNGIDYMIFSSSQDGMWLHTQDYQVQQVENAPEIVSMCIHYERLFAIVAGEQNRLVFSDDFDPTNWSESLTEGGFIEMLDERGRLTKVLSFNDYVYVFREFGVARVSAYGDQSEFSVSQLFVSGTKIYGGSVTACGDTIMLLARDGIHSFNGYSTKKLQLGIDRLFDGVDNDNSCAVYYSGKYFLACKLNFNDGKTVGCEAYSGGYVNNALLVLDLATCELEITRGVDIASMAVLDDGNIAKVVACFNGEHSKKVGELTKDGKVFEVPLKKEWASPMSNMCFPGKIKQIKECYIKTKKPCTIKISTDKHEKVFNVKGGSVSQRIKLNMIGEQVEVSFISEVVDTEITAPQITIGVTN